MGLAWRWSEIDAVCPGLEIPLARVATDGKADLSVRRLTRNFSPPQIYSGRVEKDLLAAKGSVLHWSVIVDTTEAHFRRVPSYSVQAVDLTNEALLQQLLDETDLNGLFPYLAGPLLAITATNVNSFTLEARWGVQMSTSIKTQFQKLLEVLNKYSVDQLPMTLDWIGVA